MTVYALEKNASGIVIGLASWSDDKTVLPSGFVSCAADEYAAAKSTFMNSLKDQAIGALAEVQVGAALTVAMGGIFGPKTRAYVSALQEIADGTDATSTALPTAPGAVSE
ncbi:hypothetical protein [Gluconobacter albidus]|uniref:Uncharacterized protein n=1 Tax=Gluconobacter albidus TaxID=318683 RepID=A0AAW3QYB4_9PROT|nr:hypothetical protein [Gluconobacter albidus]KXV39459.1 hypothetical protein AD941_05025 [Gluconobacter albidus]MBS1029437.1 hypothetical protein [Gluconobacter albidus]GBQ90988.1 hypothetical protein AA3250_2188 [Gluconobacter albidus NBRC 3250]GLQ69343.1 hypothetical protein GCM10007866_17940 [Gluconobacter albidus]